MERAFFVPFALIIIYRALISDSCDECCQINSQELPQYKFIKSRARSNQPILSRKRVSDVNKCKEFASSKKALAFNYGLEEGENLCQALQCPELYNFTTLMREKNYNYYSMYPDYVEPGQGTLACVPRAGIFLFASNNLNYSQAEMTCQEMNGSLAHIISEERTNGIAKFLSRDTTVYVGLSSRGAERIWKNQFDEPLSCFKYLAWGEGEPAHSRGCVGLVQPSESYSDPFWRVIPCHAALPFVCEILPAYRSSRDRA